MGTPVDEIRNVLIAGGETRLIIEWDVDAFVPKSDADGNQWTELHGRYIAARVDCTSGVMGYCAAWVGWVDSTPPLRLFDITPTVMKLEGLSGTIARFVFPDPIPDSNVADPRIETVLAVYSEERANEI